MLPILHRNLNFSYTYILYIIYINPDFYLMCSHMNFSTMIISTHNSLDAGLLLQKIGNDP